MIIENLIQKQTSHFLASNRRHIPVVTKKYMRIRSTIAFRLTAELNAERKTELKVTCGRQRLNINVAINLETLEPTTGFYETINADSSVDLFAKVEAKHPEAKAISPGTQNIAD